MNELYKNTNYFSVKHPYNLGDLITILPGLQHLYKHTGKQSIIYQQLNLPAAYLDDKDHPIKDDDGNMVTMNRISFDMVKDLLMQQDYIKSFMEWRGEEVDFDMAETRDRERVPIPHGIIHTWPFMVFPDLQCSLDEPWIDPKGILREKKIIINRTQRHYNPHIHYGFLREYEADCGFVGTAEEHAAFCEAFQVNIDRINGVDFLALAQIIYGSELFIGNQSFCWHLADAMKTTRLLEVSPQYPNTFPTGKGGWGFLYQESLRYYVKRILNG